MLLTLPHDDLLRRTFVTTTAPAPVHWSGSRPAGDAVTGDWDGTRLRHDIVIASLLPGRETASAEAPFRPETRVPSESDDVAKASSAALQSGEPPFQLSQSAIDHWCAMVEQLNASSCLDNAIDVDEDDLGRMISRRLAA